MSIKAKQLMEEKDGVIYFTLPKTDGTDGCGWRERLKKKGFSLSWHGNSARQVLGYCEYTPAEGKAYKVAILRGNIFKDLVTTEAIRNEAKRRNLLTPPIEVGCLIRESFSNSDIRAMGIWDIVVMHKPVGSILCDPLPGSGDPSYLWICSESSKFNLAAIREKFINEDDYKRDLHYERRVLGGIVEDTYERRKRSLYWNNSKDTGYAFIVS